MSHFPLASEEWKLQRMLITRIKGLLIVLYMTYQKDKILPLLSIGHVQSFSSILHMGSRLHTCLRLLRNIVLLGEFYTLGY